MDIQPSSKLQQSCGGIVPGAKREPISQEVLRMATNLALRASGIADRAHEILTPVMRVEDDTKASEIPLQTYPSYFSSVRDQLMDIEKSLDSITDALNRTEL